jgi:O-antigen/teichoic acid export membrane protein
MSLRRSVFFAFVAKYAETLIFTAGSIVLARLLTPEEIGVFSVAAAAMAVAGTVREFGLGPYIVQAEEVTPSVLRSVFWVALIISTTMAVIMVAVAPAIATVYRDVRVKETIEILAIGFVIIPFSTPVLSRIKRNMDFASFSKLTAIVAIGQVAVSTYLAWRGFGPYALALGSITNIAMTTVLGFYFLPGFEWLKPSLADWRRILPFGALSAASSAVGEITRSGTDLLIGRLTGFDAVAMYSRAQGVTDMFNRLFQDALGQIALPAAAESFRTGGDARSFYLRATELLTAVAWPFFLVLLVIADELVIVMFGSQWTTAVVPAQILCIARVIACLQTFVPTVLVARGLMRLLFRTQVAIMLATILSIAAGAAISLEAIAGASCVVQATSVIVYYAALNRAERLEWQAVAKAVRPSVVVAVVVFAVAIAVRLALTNLHLAIPLTSLTVGAASGLAWLGAIAAINHPIWRELGIVMQGLAALRRRS